MQELSTPLLEPAQLERLPHRERLLQGMAVTLGKKDYAHATVADVVRNARVSRRTFYEHFKDKEACFLACYQFMSAMLIGRIVSAARVHASAPPEQTIRAAVDAYFDTLASNHALARASLVDIQSAGTEALKQRREVHQRFADAILAQIAQARSLRPELPTISTDMATALVGGVNELAMLAFEADDPERLAAARAAAHELMMAVLLHASR